MVKKSKSIVRQCAGGTAFPAADRDVVCPACAASCEVIAHMAAGYPMSLGALASPLERMAISAPSLAPPSSRTRWTRRWLAAGGHRDEVAEVTELGSGDLRGQLWAVSRSTNVDACALSIAAWTAPPRNTTTPFQSNVRWSDDPTESRTPQARFTPAAGLRVDHRCAAPAAPLRLGSRGRAAPPAELQRGDRPDLGRRREGVTAGEQRPALG